MSNAYTDNPDLMYAPCGHIGYEWRCPYCAEEQKRQLNLRAYKFQVQKLRSRLDTAEERLYTADEIISRLCIELQRRGVSVSEVYDLAKRWYSTSAG